MRQITRRRFLDRSAKKVLGLSAVASVMTVGERARGASPNEKIILGAIGVGGRGSTLVRGFASRPDFEFAYICDLDPRRGGDLVRELKEKQGKAPEHVSNLHRVLDDKQVDAVVIATPDHWHALASVLACQAGKHVYVEKPPSHNVWEGRKTVEAARRYKRVVQVGTQNRSAPYIHKAIEFLRSGSLGKIHLCKVFNVKPGGPYRAPPDSPQPPGVDYDMWLGPAPKRPFNEGHFHGRWHAYWTYSGGDMANDGIHQLDIARWLLGKDFPKAVHCSGGKLAYPESDAEVADTQVATFEFDDVLMTFELTQWAPYMDKIAGDIRDNDLFPYWPQCATRIEIYGTKGLMYVGRHGGGWQVFTSAQKQSRPGELVAQAFGRFPDPEHKQNFIESIRNDKLPSADIEEGHRSAVLVHLANIATRLGGRRLVFNSKTETFVGDKEANALLKRDYRAPFVIPEQV